MTVLWIAGNRVAPAGLLLTGAGHLQLVRKSGTSLTEIEVQAPTDEYANPMNGPWVFEPVGQDHTDPGNTFGYGIPYHYAATPLYIGTQNPDVVWDIFSQISRQYQQASGTGLISIPYNLTYNSNSFVNTLLEAVGLSAAPYTSLLTLPDLGPNIPFIPFYDWVNPTNFIGYLGAGDSLFDYDDNVLDLVVNGGAGANFISLGYGNDQIRGLDGHDTLFGMAGNDRLSGGGGNDTLYGGDGNDQIHGGTGVDSIYGGAGHDTLIFSPTESAVHIDIRPGRLNSGAASREVYDGVEAFVGTNGNDSFSVGNGQVMFAVGGAGTDSFRIDQPGLVLVVNIPGLTHENFPYLTKDVLETALDGPLSDFSMVIINPDASDRLKVEGTNLRLQTADFDLSRFTWATQNEIDSNKVDEIISVGGFNLGSSEGNRAGQGVIQTESGDIMFAMRDITANGFIDRFESFNQDAEGNLTSVSRDPGEPNAWMNEPAPGRLFQLTNAPYRNDEGVELIGGWPGLGDPSALNAYSYHVVSTIEHAGAFALIGSVNYHAQLSAGKILNITLSPAPPLDWL